MEKYLLFVVEDSIPQGTEIIRVAFLTEWRYNEKKSP
jgi:hypothetical protein